MMQFGFDARTFAAFVFLLSKLKASHLREMYFEFSHGLGPFQSSESVLQFSPNQPFGWLCTLAIFNNELTYRFGWPIRSPHNPSSTVNVGARPIGFQAPRITSCVMANEAKNTMNKSL